MKNKIIEALSDIINNANLENQIQEIYDDLIFNAFELKYI